MDIISTKGFKKVLQLDNNGSFIIDSIKVEDYPEYYLTHGDKTLIIYVKNGYDFKLEWNNNNVHDFKVSGEGNGVKENNYLATSRPLYDKIIESSFYSMDLDSVSFYNLLDANEKKLMEFIDSKKNNLDTAFVKFQTGRYKSIKKNHGMFYNNKHAILKLDNKTAPEFVDYENHAGGTTSLSDFKGKYVYIDVWATWCGPCKREIPHLKEFEKKYHGKNIEFVSISVDQQKDYDKWKKMVTDLELTGVQLYSNDDKKFKEAYAIGGIPRFIFINPKGHIVSAQAPRPSEDEKLIALFDKVGL